MIIKQIGELLLDEPLLPPLSILLRSSTSGRAGELLGYRWQRGKFFSPKLTEFKTSSRSIEKVQQVRKNPFHGGFLQLVPLLLRAVLRLKKLNKGLTGACRKNGCCGNSGQVGQ